AAAELAQPRRRHTQPLRRRHRQVRQQRDQALGRGGEDLGREARIGRSTRTAMPGTITLDPMGPWARVTLANPGKLNAIDIAMWHELRALFERLQAMPAADAPHAIVVRGADGQFASGGDIV